MLWAKLLETGLKTSTRGSAGCCLWCLCQHVETEVGQDRDGQRTYTLNSNFVLREVQARTQTQEKEESSIGYILEDRAGRPVRQSQLWLLLS